ncbi:hypothetical protein [uncultured Clostridium sp.]|uniref:hypothetical protein n=1 Tax=uncultured Clostridium sp. TaxID=59620 RepID=UPI0026ED10CE|nr:hypothetical protein [uncultured Clostridium sp.]
MTEQERKEEVFNYFNETIFEPAIQYGKEHNIPKMSQGARYTRMRFQLLSPDKMIHYFWSAIIGTEKSIPFSKLLKDNNVLRFEDIIDEVRDRFGNEYLNGGY